MKTTTTSSPSLPLSRPRNTLNTSGAPATPAIIPLDYNYHTMAPSSALSRFVHHQPPHSGSTARNLQLEAASTQYSSLFGDPVPPPPPEDFFASEFPCAVSYSRRPSIIQLSSEEEEGFAGRHSTTRRLFPETPYSSAMTHRPSNALYAPRLQPPDIQILPNSSGGSSSDPRDSPNYALLAPDDILRRPSLYEISEPTDITELNETITISDASGQRGNSEATQRVSNFSEDFKSNVGSLGSPPPDVPELPSLYTRQYSNESYSSSEWFRPSSHALPVGISKYPEFSKMPRLRPSSKNVMSIKRDEMPMHHSPVAAMINDSNESSSGEERLLDTTVVLERATVPLPSAEIPFPAKPKDPSATYRCDVDSGLLLSPQQFLQQLRRTSADQIGSNFPLLPAPPTPPTPPAPAAPALEDSAKSSEYEVHSQAQSINREVSPVIIKDAVATGGDFRVDQARLHKKTSFTIISGTTSTPQSSRAQSPSVQPHKSQISPFLGHGFKDIASPTPAKSATKSSSSQHLGRRSLSSTQLKLPQLKPNFFASNDYPRPLVQFNMTGRRSPSKISHKGILQHRASASSSQDQSSPLPPHLHHPPKAMPSAALAYGPKMKSCEALPLITDLYRTAIPRLNRSSLDLRCESPAIPPGSVPRPLRPNPNPTRKQRGLLRVISSEESSSRIPLRSNWASMDDMSAVQIRRKSSLSPLTQLRGRRRSSSTSPERRSSTQTASDRRSSNLSSVTASDFSFRRPSLTTPQHQHQQQSRRKSLIPGSGPNTPGRRSMASELNVMKGNRTPRNRIAKPTTLSPIIGTPNKESSTSESPAVAASLTPSEIASDSTARRGSLSKIPIRNGADSRSNSRLSSRNGSRRESRSGSPTKDFPGVPISLSGLTSRVASSRSPSRATTRTESRASSRLNSKAPSRSTSRASTRHISQEPSRSSSRMEQARSVANSRSNSRLSQSSVARTGSVSPAMRKSKQDPSPLSRRKSISLSPKANGHNVLRRRPSLSPEQQKRIRVSRQSPEKQRRGSRSRIPTRATSSVQPTKANKSPPKSKKQPLMSGMRRSSPTRKSSQRSKETASAKKVPTSVRKTASSVQRTPSSVKKPPTAAKKQPSAVQTSAGGNNLKREPSNVQKKSSAAPRGAGAAATTATSAGNAVKKEASSLSLKKAGSAAEIKRLSAGIGALAAAAKVTTSKKATAEAVKGTNPAEASAGPIAGNGSGTVTGTDSASAASTASLQRQATKLRLIRAGSKLSLLSGKRSDSNLSKKFDAETTSIAEEADTSAHPGESQPGNSASVSENVSGFPAAILEKSQKTLENVQKTVTEATDEIKKTINDNLTDLKSLESNMSRVGGYDSAASPTSSVATVVENKSGGKAAALSVSRTGTAEGIKGKPKSTGTINRVPVKEAQKSPAPPTQPIEAAVSVINGVATSAVLTSNASGQRQAAGDDADLAERNYELGIDDKTGSGVDGIAEAHAGATNGVDDFKMDAKRRSPDGQGGSTTESGDKTSSQDYLEEKQSADGDSKGGCCRCCTTLCMPCRRSRCSRCCSRKKSPSSDSISNNNNNDEDEQPVLANLDVVNEKKTSCWSKLNCCKPKNKESKAEEPMAQLQIQTIQEESPGAVHQTSVGKQSNKCGLCMSKVFCCRSVNKVKTTSSGSAVRPGNGESDVRKCCFCIPCGRKRGASGSSAWQDPEVPPIVPTDASVLEGMDATPEPKQGCFKHFCSRLFCCRKNPPPATGLDSRRASMKQAAPPEETRRKLHVDLVEYNSKMKGAIPVLPLYLAWFCAICNTVFPGLGTLFSGIFCVCVGIPRFSHYDSAKGRLGSLIINTIVGLAQFFCVLFCFVGWGWSIWWGTIMLKCAKKLSKIKKVERLEMEDERRQLEQAAAAATAAATPAATGTPPASETKVSKK